MSSRFEWLDYRDEERRRVREVMATEKESEANDPLGLGVFQRTVSERMFPGTSTQHTRLRYAVMIPALLQSKPRLRASDLSARQRQLNVALTKHQNDGAKGIVGRRNPNRRFIPAYWSALRTWRFFDVDEGVTGTPALALRRSTPGRDEDGNAFTHDQFRWHAGLVPLMERFLDAGRLPAAPAIRCTAAERAFVLSRWRDLQIDGRPTVLATLAEEASAERLNLNRDLWGQLGNRHRHHGAARDLLNAKRTSIVCWSLQLAYNLELIRQARKAEQGKAETLWLRRHVQIDIPADAVNRELLQWERELGRDKHWLGDWTSSADWVAVGAGDAAAFLARAAERLANNQLDLEASPWREAVVAQEAIAKAHFPMLSRTAALAGWSGTPEMAQRMSFRWGNVRTLLADAGANNGT